MGNTSDTWPAGSTYVFQGTVAEDATAGTHVCSLTVTPGVGSEMQVLYGRVAEGNTATAQTMAIYTTDGSNTLATFVNMADTTANVERSFPSLVAPVTNTNQFMGTVQQTHVIISGTEQFIMKVTTAAVSVTQTFSLVCRIKGAKPTATLNDTIGTSTNTVNTDKVF